MRISDLQAMQGFLKYKKLSSKGRGDVLENTVNFWKSENNSDEEKAWSVGSQLLKVSCWQRGSR